MVEQDFSHPSPDRLQDFGLGRLPAADCAQVETHINSCDQCRRTVETAADDSLIVRLRASHSAACSLETPGGAGNGERLLLEMRGHFAPAQTADELGRLGDYRLCSVLGQGGMGVVFLAEDTRLRRQVAVKVMRPELAVNSKARERFCREAQTVAGLQHDHIVSIHHVDDSGPLPYLVMPLLGGKSLEDYLDQEYPWDPVQIVRIGREIALGLAAAHERGIVHRDIKPANIWLEPKDEHPLAPTENFRVKLLDFGLARLAIDDLNLTSPGTIMGTPSYMAPEQARGEAVDARADLFSLGCVLYQLCTGRPPFKRDNLYSTVAALATETPVPVANINPQIPAPLAELIVQLVSRRAGDRPQTAAEAANRLAALEQTVADEPTTVFSMSGGVASSAGIKVRKRYRFALWLTAGAAVLLLGGLSYLAYTAFSITQVETAKGTLVIETKVSGVKVIVKQDGKRVIIIDTNSKNQIELKEGTYELELGGGNKKLMLSAERFTLKRRGKEIVRVYWRPKTALTAIKVTSLPTPREGHMCARIGDKLFVIGGQHRAPKYTFEIFDAKSRIWTIGPALPKTDGGEARRYDGSLVVHDGKLWLIGGWRLAPGQPTNTLVVYDPARNAWSARRPMPILSGDSVAGVIEGKIYVLTSQDGFTGFRGLLHVYDPQANTWKKLPPAPKAIPCRAAAVMGDKLYVVGGGIPSKGKFDFVSVLHVYDPSVNRWTSKAPLPTPRANLTLVAHKGKLYAIGGYDAEHNPLDAVESYDPVTDKWTKQLPLPRPRAGHQAVSVDDGVWLIGGRTRDPASVLTSVDSIRLK